mmetsp:Transcript_53067/g.92605  ORF Transcript_53067/g.92605 Transcript_53067/m.92605 type:complete len:277 (+) Transcript_53067:1247-2077(+)
MHGLHNDHRSLHATPVGPVVQCRAIVRLEAYTQRREVAVVDVQSQRQQQSQHALVGKIGGKRGGFTTKKGVQWESQHTAQALLPLHDGGDAHHLLQVIGELFFGALAVHRHDDEVLHLLHFGVRPEARHESGDREVQPLQSTALANNLHHAEHILRIISLSERGLLPLREQLLRLGKEVAHRLQYRHIGHSSGGILVVLSRTSGKNLLKSAVHVLHEHAVVEFGGHFCARSHWRHFEIRQHRRQALLFHLTRQLLKVGKCDTKDLQKVEGGPEVTT